MHRCDPKGADKKKIYTCAECKLTWVYRNNPFIEEDDWYPEFPLTRKTRERIARLDAQRKRNREV